MKTKSKKDLRNTVSAKIAGMVPKTSGKTASSLRELLNTGSTVTGYSGYSKGWGRKDIWTMATVLEAQKVGLVVESGNNAPRGGANGEYVALVSDRRKNKIVHQYHALLSRKRKIDMVKRAKVEAARTAAQVALEAEIMAEFEILKPFALLQIEEIKTSWELGGEKKSHAQAQIMKGLLVCAGVEKLKHFWKVWKHISTYASEVIHQEVINNMAAIEGPRITKEYFHTVTGACYTGINGFLVQKFGTSDFKDLPLSVVLEIAPETYKRKLGL